MHCCFEARFEKRNKHFSIIHRFKALIYNANNYQ